MSKESERIGRAEVSIILPAFNDAEWVAAALESCLAQTLRQIEIIVVDDASTDETTAIVERYRASDARIRLIRQDANRSAFQARRVGVEAATAPFVLFLDGDDELLPTAAATAVSLARRRNADVVAFGSQVVRPNGATGGDYESAMQPRHDELAGEEIVAALFPVGKTAQGQLWRYLFAKGLLTAAYASLPAALVLPRMNDLPIAFLALMRARKYVSTPTVLYRYFFRRGASGHSVTTIDDYHFIANSIESIESIAETVAAESQTRRDGDALSAAYESARLSVVGRVLDYVNGIVDDELRSTGLSLLTARVGLHSLIAACADFCPSALPLLAASASPPPLTERSPRHILLRVANLRTGGVQAVAVAQAGYLRQAGLTVTIAVDSVPHTQYPLPEGVEVVQVSGRSLAQRIACFAEVCRSRDVDVVIDHHILYNDWWPYFALAVAADRIPTIGWIHNFALRPILDGNTRMSYLRLYLPLLATVVVLSEADVSYWKLRGVPQVAYLPNPPSPLLESLPARTAGRAAPTGPLEVVWWGRLQQATKQVRELIEIGSGLRDLGVDFRLTIIGPDSADLTAAQLHDLARARGIDDKLVTPGPLHGDDLLAAIDHAHVYVSTSIIEGYPLALVEAQALGLPLVMYELPWLATMRGNAGVVAVKQGDRHAAARALATLATDQETYETLAGGALDAARDALAHDFVTLYTDLVEGRLAPVHSPEPSTDDMRVLLHQNALFTERLIRQQRELPENGQPHGARSRTRNDTKSGLLKRNAPWVASTGVKGWLQRILPATMRQAGFYARYQHTTTTKQFDELVRKQEALSDQLRRMEATITASLSAMGNELASKGRAIRSVEERLAALDGAATGLAAQLDEGAATTSEILRLQERGARVVGRVGRAVDEVVWSEVFHDTIIDSAWFTDRTLSPGRWAVGYPFLYVLYRVLDEVAPASILELGLGQSTKLVSQYARHSSDVQHIVVEHDPSWIETFAANYTLSADTRIVELDLVHDPNASASGVQRYAGFAPAVGAGSYDLIIIDGPFGYDQDLARIDVLDIVPDSIAERFVIMLDDAHRTGEQAATEKIVEALERAKVPHVIGTYRGQKDLWIAASPDLAFLTTL